MVALRLTVPLAFCADPHPNSTGWFSWSGFCSHAYPLFPISPPCPTSSICPSNSSVPSSLALWPTVNTYVTHLLWNLQSPPGHRSHLPTLCEQNLQYGLPKYSPPGQSTSTVAMVLLSLPRCWPKHEDVLLCQTPTGLSRSPILTSPIPSLKWVRKDLSNLLTITRTVVGS